MSDSVNVGQDSRRGLNWALGLLGAVLTRVMNDPAGDHALLAITDPEGSPISRITRTVKQVRAEVSACNQMPQFDALLTQLAEIQSCVTHAEQVVQSSRQTKRSVAECFLWTFAVVLVLSAWAIVAVIWPINESADTMLDWYVHCAHLAHTPCSTGACTLLICHVLYARLVRPLGSISGHSAVSAC